MKYIKGNFKGSLDHNNDKNTILGKQRLTMPDGFSENIWIGKRDDESENVVLLNHALIFSPFESWGMIIPKGKSNMNDLRKNEIITLHPDAFDQYIKEGIINEEGTPLVDYEEKIAVYRGEE